jgi:hypothetical protein
LLMDSAWALHQQMSAWFDGQDYVKRYSPFGTCSLTAKMTILAEQC